MKKSILLAVMMLSLIVFPQAKPILYFTADYDMGEKGIGTSFSRGEIVVMVKSDKPLNVTNVLIQFDKYIVESNSTGWEFYNQFKFTVTPKGSYFYFKRKDMVITNIGIYRAFLMDEKRNIISNAIVEIVK